MTYILDGIETAMERGRGYNNAYAIKCPCGWEALTIGGDPEPALRFHYTHCPKARVPGPRLTFEDLATAAAAVDEVVTRLPSDSKDTEGA